MLKFQSSRGCRLGRSAAAQTPHRTPSLLPRALQRDETAGPGPSSQLTEALRSVVKQWPQRQQGDKPQRWCFASSRSTGTEQHDGAKQLLLAASTGLMGTGFAMEGPISTLQALGVLAAIVAVHEAGHFTAARVQGIKVSRFAIGFGPTLWSYKGPEVEYCLNLIPLGGYVAFPDDDPSKEGELDPEDPGLLKNRSIPSRALVISAGVVANLIFAFAVLFAQVTTVGKAETAYDVGVRIPKINPNSAAEQAGFKDGDIVLKVGDTELLAAPEQVRRVVGAIQDSPGRELVFVIKRGGDTLQLPVVPDLGYDGKGRIGVALNSNVVIEHTVATSFDQALSLTTSEFNRLSTTVWGGLRALATNLEKALGQLSGPVAIVAAGSEIARTDAAGLFQFCAIVNINLAAVNILPLPALDGGYMVLLFLEALRGGKKLNPKVEGAVMASGLLVLTAMGIGLVVKDTVGLLPL